LAKSAACSRHQEHLPHEYWIDRQERK